jgi:cytochrome c oxidase subunit 2
MAAPEEETGGIRDRQRDRASIIQLVVLGVVSSLIGIALALWIDWFPAAASTQAGPIDTLWDVLLIFSVPVFVLVQAIVLYCVWKFRMRPGQELQDGPPIHGNTRLEVVWTLIPAIIILGLCTYAYLVLEDIEEAKAQEMQINVVGQQFTWTFEYPGVGEGKPIRSEQLYVPEDQPVEFRIKSRDVIHDFWVPAWRMKIDAVPGIETRYRVTPKDRGRYEVVCAELCGLGHAYMRQTANVLSREDFDKWVASKNKRGGTAGGAGAGGASAQIDGKTLFTDGNGESTACGACHTLADAGTSSETGPSMDESLKDMDAAAIRKAIVEPNADVAKGFSQGIMPDNYGDLLSREELDALVKYLDEVSK